MTWLPRTLLALGAAALAAAPAGAQRERAADDWRVDPYTRGADGAMAKAGYVSFGPFAWGDGHDTRAILRLLGNVPLLWAETAHFKLGSALPPYAIPAHDRRQRDKIRAELERLRDRLPGVDPRVKELDRWLRVHLFAQRLEELYADFCGRLDVADEDFPESGVPGRGAWMGKGRYLGMPAKYTVLLLQRESDYRRYLQRWVGVDVGFSQRFHFRETGSLFFGTATALNRGRLADDSNMHCTVVFNVVHNLVNGYRYFFHELPVWFEAGLAQWYLRRIDPRWNNFNQNEAGEADTRAVWDWEPKVRGLVAHGNFTPARTVLRRSDYRGWRFADHMTVWSRVDYLMSLGDRGLRVFLHGMKEPFAGGMRPVEAEEILARQERLLRRAWGLDAESFDRRWSAWVLKRYRKRPKRGIR